MNRLTNDQKWERWFRYIKENKLSSKMPVFARGMKLPIVRNDKPLVFHGFLEITLIGAVYWGVSVFLLSVLYFSLTDLKPNYGFLTQGLVYSITALLYGMWIAWWFGRLKRKYNLNDWESFGENHHE